MSSQLRQYLVDAYIGRSEFLTGKRVRKDFPIQIDDQDDNDALDNFCTIFVTIGQQNVFELEISGKMPITSEIKDLAEIYGGSADALQGRLILRLSLSTVEAVTDLAAKIRATAFQGHLVNNPAWESISARTISSLLRFVRVLREYKRLHNLTEAA